MVESGIYCNVVINLDEFNISHKTLFTIIFIEYFRNIGTGMKVHNIIKYKKSNFSQFMHVKIYALSRMIRLVGSNIAILYCRHLSKAQSLGT